MLADCVNCDTSLNDTEKSKDSKFWRKYVRLAVPFTDSRIGISGGKHLTCDTGLY